VTTRGHHGVDVRLVRVIVTAHLEEFPPDGRPARTVFQIFSTEGEWLAAFDPFKDGPEEQIPPGYDAAQRLLRGNRA
jgi:hypothetical protein